MAAVTGQKTRARTGIEGMDETEMGTESGTEGEMNVIKYETDVVLAAAAVIVLDVMVVVAAVVVLLLDGSMAAAAAIVPDGMVVVVVVVVVVLDGSMAPGLQCQLPNPNPKQPPPPRVQARAVGLKHSSTGWTRTIFRNARDDIAK